MQQSPSALGSLTCSWTDLLTHYQDSRRQIVEKQFLRKASEAHCLGYSPDDDANAHKKLAILQDKFKQSFIADLEQGEEHGHVRYNNMMPCLISHGEYWSSHLQRPLLAEEFFVVQGFPIFGMHKESEMPEFEGMVVGWGLSQAQLKDLGGNTMHLDVLNALFIYLRLVVVVAGGLYRVHEHLGG